MPHSLATRLQIRVGRRALRLGSSPVRRLLRRPPHTVGTRTLDPELQHMLWVQSLGGRKGLPELSVERARREYGLMPLLFEDPMEEPATQHRTVGGAAGSLPAAIYGARTPEPGPAIVFFHGGGGVVGDLHTHDVTCRKLALASGCRVISVEYRLAPEHPFPAGHDDAVASFRWVVQHAKTLGVDPRRIAVAGDSMGANLAAGLCLACRDDPPAFALLLYPGTLFAEKMASHTELSRGFFLDGATIDWFHAHYLGDASPADPRASVLRAPDLSGLPPTFVATAGFDPLRDEGQAYAAALEAAGNDVEHREYSGLVHGFVQMTGVCRAADAAFADFGTAVARALSRV